MGESQYPRFGHLEMVPGSADIIEWHSTCLLTQLSSPQFFHSLALQPRVILLLLHDPTSLWLQLTGQVENGKLNLSVTNPQAGQ